MKALLLIGSPRMKRSASFTLGRYLLDQLAEHDVAGETHFVKKDLRSDEATDELIDAVIRADLVILSTPLYVDSLPAPVTRALEILSQHLDQSNHPARQQFVAICNSGFPEAEHNDIALAICEQFAHATGFTWAGGLALGGGGVVQGRSLTESEGRARNVITALDQTAEALARGDAVPEEAQALMRKPIIPPWMYRTIGQIGWHVQARTYGQFGKLRQRPWAASTKD
jgi:hypothetical protein